MDNAFQVTQTRSMVHSYSALHVPNYDVHDNDQFKRSNSVNDLTHADLRHARKMFLQHLCCPSCSVVEYGLRSVEGENSALFCPQCYAVVGLDDTMNYYDLVDSLRNGQYYVEPCSTCGNTDPYSFEVELRADCDDDGLEMCAIKCLKCCGNSQSAQLPTPTESEHFQRDGSKDSARNDMTESEPLQIECGCGNFNMELFNVVKRDSGDVDYVECLVCCDILRMSQKSCSCWSDCGHDTIYDEFGYVVEITCRNCQAVQNCGAQDSIPRKGSKGIPEGRTQVKTLALLKRGDHIAWHQTLSYWHHAIVTNVDEAKSMVSVINYDGPNKPNKGKIVEEEKHVNLMTEELYRIEYALSDCYHPLEVVARAKERLGEARYNLLNNNCEHFARWCKTGHELSLQRESFVRSCWKGVSAYVASLSNLKIPFKGVSAMANDELEKASAKIMGTAAGTAKDVMKRELSGTASTVLSSRYLLPLSVVVVSEITFVLRGIQNAKRLRQEGNISREEFIKITIKHVTRGVGSLTGVGVAIAIPLTRNSIGMTLGSLIGNSVGCIAGRKLGVLYDKFAGAN